MKKSKKLLLVVLALAILTSLTAGTLAVYTKTVSLTGQIEAKKFAFTATGGIEGDKKAINLAPTESMSYNFKLTNQDGTATAEVPMDYAITVNFAEAATKMPGLTAVLAKVDSDGNVVSSSAITAANGQISDSNVSDASVAFNQNYRVTLTWAGSDNAAQTVAGNAKVTLENGLNVTVVATQNTTR